MRQTHCDFLSNFGAGGHPKLRENMLWPPSMTWLAAALAIRHYGENAKIEAARRADLMLERDDHDGQSLWLQIRRAIAPRHQVQ
jgi:hypothetical protein